MQLEGISWLNGILRILQSAVYSWTTALQSFFRNFLFLHATKTITSFTCGCHPELHQRSHTRMRRLNHWRYRLLGWLQAGRRAWLQLPHMTSPFAPNHSIHLPSPGSTMDKDCLNSVCVVTWKSVSFTKRHVFLSIVFLCGWSVCTEFTVSLFCHLPLLSSPLLSSPLLCHFYFSFCVATLKPTYWFKHAPPPTWMHIDRAQNERSSTLVNLVKLCFHWLIRSDFMAAIGQCVSTPLCTHKHTHRRAHISTFKHTVCSTSCVELSGWHHLQLQCQRVKVDHRLAALAPCPSALLWVCVHVCVCVCVRACVCVCGVCVCVVNVTAWPLWSSLISCSFSPCICPV